MKKMLNTIVVLGIAGAIALTPAKGAVAGVSLLPGIAPACDNVPASFQTPSVIVFLIENKDDSSCIVFMQTANNGQQLTTTAQALSCLPISNIIEPAEGNAAKHTSIAGMLPEPETIVALGLAGLMLNRQKKR